MKPRRTFATGWREINTAESRLQLLRTYSSIYEPIHKVEVNLVSLMGNQLAIFMAVPVSSEQVLCIQVYTRLDTGHIITSHPLSPFHQQVVTVHHIHYKDTKHIEFSNNHEHRSDCEL